MRNLFNPRLITLLLSLFVLTQINAQQNSPVHKVVIQLNTADTASWSGVIGNIKNIQKVWPNNLNIEVVVHGKALNFLVKDRSHLALEIDTLVKKGVCFNACENTMQKHSINKDMLLPNVTIVSSGIAEIILKQEAGWSYLKSGL
jgi:intracellular sulfur oxidation DsrE/DsrF family protein